MNPNPTNKDSGSGEELDRIFYTHIGLHEIDTKLPSYGKSPTVKAKKIVGWPEAKAALAAYTQRQALLKAIDELEHADEYGGISARVATLTQQLNDITEGK
jgi:hypothetical protein